MSRFTIRLIGRVQGTRQTGYTYPLIIGTGPTARTAPMPLDPKTDPQTTEPMPHPDNPIWWLCRGSLYGVEGHEGLTEDEIKLRLKHFAIQQDKQLQRIRREVEAFENLDRLPSARRERIPESVRLFVWQRDGGCCVQCGSRERLEFDHIIPVAEGGSSTERNIQLLCTTNP